MPNNMFYVGVVENRLDPLKLGRCQVRIVGLHIHDKTILPTEDLPWAYPMQPATSAAMSGIGHSPVGPVEGTSVIIMFHDYPDNQQPIMLGTIGGIPQKNSVNIGQINDDSIMYNPNTKTTESVPETNEAAASTETSNVVPQTTPTTDIPTTLPSWYRGSRAAAEANLKALLAECEKQGLTTREQKCTVLAIVGGESAFIPQSEKYNGSSREAYFEGKYGYQTNVGKNLGNKSEGDGAKYYGRGYIQLTGRSNYTEFSKKTGLDLVNNPDILNSDSSVSASVAVAFIRTRTSANPNAHPGYFLAAAKRVNPGNPVTTIKQNYYDYFYGIATEETVDTTSDAVSKSAAPNPPKDQINDPSFVPGSTSGGYRSGFQDPNNKYPLSDLINEPDTHRLARGIYQGTIVPIKDAARDVGIPTALDADGKWDQPTIPYGAKYPFNHTFESESGHIHEVDDTPGYERIHFYHRKGTWEEIDAHGTRVVRVAGDNYEIMERNGCIHIMGTCNVTVDGNINVFCRSNANIEVSGNAKMHVGGDYELGVTGDMSVAVGGTYSVYSKGDMNHQTDAVATSKSGSTTYITSGGDVQIKAAGDAYLGADSSAHLVGTSGAYATGGTLHLLALSGNLEMDGAFVNLGNSTAQEAIFASEGSDHVLEVPTARDVINPNMPYLESPPLEGEEIFQFETEEEWQTPAGQIAKADTIRKYGDQTPDNTPATESAQPSGGTNVTVPASCEIIFNTDKFTGDYRLSPNFTLGMLLNGAAGTHALVAQNGLTIQEIVCNLSQLCKNILEPAVSSGLLPGGMAGFRKQWQINSGFRAPNGPDHGCGRAVDITLLPYDSTKKQRNFDLVKQLEKILPYDQIIMEYRGTSNWIHIGYRGEGTVKSPSKNRKMAFTMLNDKTYGQGFHLL